MTNKQLPSPLESLSLGSSKEFSPSTSLRELLDSLSKEQKRNQELLVSLGFVLRSFTNLSRFLELVPIVASRLVGVKGALLVPFKEDGRIWSEHIYLVSSDKFQELLNKLFACQAGMEIGFAFDETNLLNLDRLVQNHFLGAGIFVTSVVSRGKQRGRLYVFEPKGLFAWSNVHRRHIQLIADITGVAIENNIIVQENRRHESVDRQLSTGAEIQAQLLPDSCPVIEGVELAACCRTAFQVGGDYYDFMPTRPELTGRRKERGRWALVIGDVMGKGIPAGLLMTMLRGMLRAEVISGLPPDRILHDLNQLALEDLSHSHRFVTLFYSDFDPRSRKLRFANAAHNPPLLWQANSRTVSRLDAPGLLIGLQSEAEYICGEVILEPGDVLLCYTDGVTEAPGMAGDRFDEARLIKILDECARDGLVAQSILEKLFKRLDAFVGKDHCLEDDASMVVLKVNGDLALPSISKTYA